MDQKGAIEKDLREIGAKGKILFDLLLSHGNTPDRFFEAMFDGHELIEDSLKSVASIPEKIKEISSDFYYSRQNYLENSVLSRAQKFLIKNKAPLKAYQT